MEQEEPDEDEGDEDEADDEVTDVHFSCIGIKISWLMLLIFSFVLLRNVTVSCYICNMYCALPFFGEDGKCDSFWLYL